MHVISLLDFSTTLNDFFTIAFTKKIVVITIVTWISEGTEYGLYESLIQVIQYIYSRYSLRHA